MLGKFLSAGLIIGLTVSVLSCKKSIEIDAPPNSTNAANVYKSDATAAAVLTGIYTKMSDLNSDLLNPSINSITIYLSLLSDELRLFNLNDGRINSFYTNDLAKEMGSVNSLWASIYQIVFVSNSAIEGLTSSEGLTAGVKNHLIGEAKFIRAFCYFYLVNLYHEVPLVLGTNAEFNRTLARSSTTDVYAQIIEDLTDAQSLLEGAYLQSDAITPYIMSESERVRPNKWAATALLSRVYLFTGNWEKAEIESSKVIEQSSLYELMANNKTFEMNNKETIWALQPVKSYPTANTGEGALFVLPPDGPNNNDYPVYLDENLIGNFEIDDNRRVNWIDSVKTIDAVYYMPVKYRMGKGSSVTTEYSVVLRLAEQYLIRAEARAKLGNISGSRTDLNRIRTRSGLPDITVADQNMLLANILQERRMEFFSEWGHRWLDLIRTDKIDSVMSLAAPQKGGIWMPHKKYLPIPQDEINLDPKLAQNPGY